jgi:tetratricopeptide (TPR) repeat protein
VSTSLAMALAGWARRLAGHDEDALNMLRRAREINPDLPYAWIIEAFIHFSVLTAAEPLVRVQPTLAGLAVEKQGSQYCRDTDPLQARLDTCKTLKALCQKAASAITWDEVTEPAFRKLIAAMLELQGPRGEFVAPNFATAQPVLSETLRYPVLAWLKTDIFFARAKIFHALGTFEAGLPDIDEVLRFRPNQVEACICKAELKSAKAVQESRVGKDAQASLREAHSLFSDAVKRNPDSVEAFCGRANSGMNLAHVLNWPSPACGEILANAASDAEEALKRNPNSPDAALCCARSVLARAEFESLNKRDPRELCQKLVGTWEDRVERNQAPLVFTPLMRTRMWQAVGRARLLQAKAEPLKSTVWDKAAQAAFHALTQATDTWDTATADGFCDLGSYHLWMAEAKPDTAVQERFYAYTAFSNAAKKDDVLWQPHAAMGRILFGQGKYAEAVVSLKAAINRNADEADLQSLLGEAVSRSKQ